MPHTAQAAERAQRGTLLARVTSRHHNGDYEIRRLADGSPACTCLSFLGQHGLETRNGVAVCKHIRKVYEDLGQTVAAPGARPASPWQVRALGRLGADNPSQLTWEQAYLVFGELLRKQGIGYRELAHLMKGEAPFSVLPTYSFGVEIEAGVSGRGDLLRALRERGLPAADTGYSHETMACWKISSDGSVLVPGLVSVELVSPKLFGAEGFDALGRACEALAAAGGKVNETCGLHVHVDAYWTREELVELAKVWVKAEQKAVWPLVDASRWGNRYCRRLAPEEIAAFAIGRSPDRYRSLNLSAFSRYGTAEFRIHHGTVDAAEIADWAVFLLMLSRAVKRGLRSPDIDLSALDLPGLLDRIGMTEGSSTSRIARARKRLLEARTRRLLAAARLPGIRLAPDGRHADGIDPADGDGIRLLVARREAVEAAELVYARWPLSGDIRRSPGTDGTAGPTVRNLASLPVRFRVPAERVIDGLETGRWELPADREGSAAQRPPVTVALDAAADTLSCGCTGFSRSRRCVHASCVARFLTAYRRQLERYLSPETRG